MALFGKRYSFGLRTPVVLDIGEAYTKLGFAGEAEPRAIIPTAIEQVGGPVVYIYSRNQLSTVKHGLPENFKKSIELFLEKIYFKYLQVNPKDQRVILCESLLNPTKVREGIAKVLFTKFDVPSILFAPNHLLACFTIAASTALVLDCSYSESLVIPVINGTPVLWAWQSAPLGGAVVHDTIMEDIVASGKIKTEDKEPNPITSRLTEQVLEDIKVKACFVTEYNRAKQIKQAKTYIWNKEHGVATDSEELRPMPPPDMVYPINGKTQLFIPGCLREDAAEILFQQDNEQVSLATLVLDSLMHCPIDSRRFLAANILITGGTSMLPGFKHRLLFELKEAVQQGSKYWEKLSECKFCIHDPPVQPNLVAWLGGAIFSSLDVFANRSVTKEYFVQHNERLPDWCVLDLKRPERESKRKTTKKFQPVTLSQGRKSAIPGETDTFKNH